MICGGTIGVPGATGGGELAGAFTPLRHAGIHLEQVGQALLGREPELENDVLKRVVVVVDFDLVQDVRVEWELVGAVGWLQERIDAENERDLRGVGWVIADERVEIGDVGLVIERGDRRLAVARRMSDHAGDRPGGNGRREDES